MWAVVPYKESREAKQRLAGVLAPDERRRLSFAMLEDVLAVLAAAECLSGVVLVSRDPEAARLARRLGAVVLLDPVPAGQSAAATLAARSLAGGGRRGMVTIPADVPLLTTGEIAQIVRVHGTAPAVTIVPARDHRGSNAVACSPPDIFPFGFGDDSFLPHLATARRLGIDPAVVKLPGLGLDIDRPDDLLALLDRPSKSRALAYLEESGIAERLRGDEVHAAARRTVEARR